MKTRMLNTHGTCPYCGATISLSYVEKEWKYGSPIRTCKKCKKNYIDGRYHEIAVEGIAPNTLSIKSNLLRSFFLLGCFLIAFLIHFYEIHYQNCYHPAYCYLMIIMVIGIIFLIIDSIRIKTGAKTKKLEKLRLESVKRLMDNNYAHELESIGYCVPDEYL